MRFAHGLALIDIDHEGGTSVPTPDNQRGYMGLSSTNNPASVNISGFASASIVGVPAFTLLAGPSTNGDFLIILAPSTFNVLQIFNPDIAIVNELPAYTVTADVRQIDSVDYTSYVLGPLNPDLNFTRTVSTVAP